MPPDVLLWEFPFRPIPNTCASPLAHDLLDPGHAGENELDRRGGLTKKQLGHLREETGGGRGVHGDDLNRDAAIIERAADDAAATNLSYGKIEKYLHEAAKRQGFLSTD